MAERWDALVIGGGPAGSATAILLARAGWSVALLERKGFPRRKVCGEYLSATNLPLLAHLGVAEVFRETAGPEVRQVGLFAGDTVLRADLPRSRGNGALWGRALGREHLDTLLLRQALKAGVEVRQPWSAVGLIPEGNGYRCLARSEETGATSELESPIVVAAHGSWEPGPLPTQAVRRRPRPGDLFGFKAHFRDTELPPGLMPLLVFPGGYGGMVHSDGGRLSLSCCIRRDWLARLRQGARAESAGEAVLAHIVQSCLGARRALAGAPREGTWLSAGPLRTGIRAPGSRGVFRAGNSAGEAHPVIAEGISMALQAGWLLARHLLRWKEAGGSARALVPVGAAYARAWRRAFAPRLYAAAAVAHWAMRPTVVAGTLPWLRWFPGLLSWGARLSGKATRVVSASPWPGEPGAPVKVQAQQKDLPS
jgi:flavin-dependent dehydrogenase